MRKLKPKELGNECYVLVDTSILMLINKGIDVISFLKEEGCKCLVTPSVLLELEKHARSVGKKRVAAKWALEVVKRECSVLDVERKKRADDEIVESALRFHLPVATADVGLRRKVLRKVPTIYYRESQHRLEKDWWWE